MNIVTLADSEKEDELYLKHFILLLHVETKLTIQPWIKKQFISSKLMVLDFLVLESNSLA